MGEINLKAIDYAFCCAEAGGDTRYCDCVNKNHGKALTEALIIAEGYNTGASWAVAEHISEPLKAALATKGADSND